MPESIAASPVPAGLRIERAPTAWGLVVAETATALLLLGMALVQPADDWARWPALLRVGHFASSAVAAATLAWGFGRRRAWAWRWALLLVGVIGVPSLQALWWIATSWPQGLGPGGRASVIIGLAPMLCQLHVTLACLRRLDLRNESTDQLPSRDRMVEAIR